MGVVLFCLAIAMIVGGGAAVYSGSLIIAVERGWSMMIAGSVCASAGAVVLGLAVLAGRLRSIADQTESLGETMSRIEMASWGPPPPLPTDDVDEARGVSIGPEPVKSPVHPPEPIRYQSTPRFETDPLPQAAPEIVTSPPAPVIAFEEIEPAPVEPARLEIVAPTVPTVVGSYSAGENAYLMYSDGSIQADTPEGRFRFGSLDELKAYVAEAEQKTRAASTTDAPPQTSPVTAEIANA